MRDDPLKRGLRAREISTAIVVQHAKMDDAYARRDAAVGRVLGSDDARDVGAMPVRIARVVVVVREVVLIQDPVGDAQGETKGARITGAIALSEAEVLRWLAARIERRSALRWIALERRVEALLEQRLGAIAITRGPDPEPDPAAIAAFVAERVAAEGLDLLPLSATSRNLLIRARYAGIEALSDEELAGRVGVDPQWAPVMRGARDLNEASDYARQVAEPQAVTVRDRDSGSIVFGPLLTVEQTVVALIAPGDYRATLTVTDDSGQQDSDDRGFSVK